MAKEPAEFLICALADMADGAAKSFNTEVLGKKRMLFGVRRRGDA